MNSVDVIVIGGGILGLATAYNLVQQYPRKKVMVLEKEQEIGRHQTGHNSGVLHSGIYYKPGSLKAVTCRTGKKRMEAFCAREGIDYRVCGKVIVACDEGDLSRLNEIYARGQANGVDCVLINRHQLSQLEPHVAGIKAIHVRETGIVDYQQVCRRLAARVQEAGHVVLTGARVIGIELNDSRVLVRTTAGDLTGSYAINCGGLHSDRIAALASRRSPARIVPFRGEYYELKAEAEYLCNNLVYPVPDPNFPFLGVHLTRITSGKVECGPNAVLAFSREGYRKTDVSIVDMFETLSFPGFRKLAARYWRKGLGEFWRSISKAAFVTALRRLVPDLRTIDLLPRAAGVRAQAITQDGALLDDFCFQEGPRVINVLNAPSPAATASLSIGRLIVGRLARQF